MPETIETARVHASTSGLGIRYQTGVGRHGLEHCEMRGLSPRQNPLASLLDFHRRAKGRISFKELGRRLGFQESNLFGVSYMGYTRRKGERHATA